MNLIKSSLVFKLLNKLDIQENSFFQQIVQESFFIKKLNNFLEQTQVKFSEISKTSNLIKIIDYIILGLISLILISIPFLETKIIGFFTAVGFAVLLIKFCCVKGEKHYFNSFDIPIFLYILIAGLSVTFSSFFIPSIKGYIKILIYFGGYLTFINIFKNHPKRIIYLMVLLTITVSIEAFYAIYQQITGIEPLAAWQDRTEVNPELLMNRVYGSLKPYNPNLLGGYLVAGFSSALGTAFLFLNRKKFIFSFLSFIGVAAVLLAILFTGSRGVYIATAAMIGVFMIISGHIIWHEFNQIKWLKKFWMFLGIFGLISLIALVLFSPALQHRILSIFAFRGDSSNSFRFNVYFACIKIFLDNWLTGIGTGNNTFRLVYGLYMTTGFDALGSYNIFLEIAVESGIFALLSFIWLILLSFISGIKYFVKNNSLENKIIVSSCLIGIAGLMVHGFFDTIWYRPQVNLIFWMLIAILAIIISGNIYTSPKETKPKTDFS
ncbi:MAG: O-antigen ligase family protein [bacterium]